jgi:hypothetical protein
VKARRQWSEYAAEQYTQPSLIDPESLAVAQPKRRRPGTVKRPVIPERDIQKVILDGLLRHPLVARIERINVMAGRLLGKDGVSASRFMRSCRRGRVDLDGFSVDGKIIAIEVKRPATRNTVTPEQQEYIDQVKKAGGLAGVATCYEEAVAIVEGRI